MTERTRFTIACDVDVYEAFADLAHVSGVSMSRCIGDWLRDTAEAAQMTAIRVNEVRKSPEEALRAYTSGAAYAAFREKDLGTLEVGKLADLVIIDRDIVEDGPDSIADAKVELTMVGGRIVYEREKGENGESTPHP